jgi:hypothetical protein
MDLSIDSSCHFPVWGDKYPENDWSIKNEHEEARSWIGCGCTAL